MGDVLAASDALIHSSAGLTVLEAIIRGCPVISYGFGYGHVRASNHALERFGLAQVARSLHDLPGALDHALARRPDPDPSFARRPSTASLILSDERRTRPLPAWRLRAVRGAVAVGATLIVAAWTLTTGASYSLVSHIVHIRPMTAVQTSLPEVGVMVDAPTGKVPALADQLSRDGIRATFALSQLSLPAVRSILYYRDRAIPRLGGGGLVRWLETGDQLHHLVGPLGIHHHFEYASSGPSLGQWWLAHSAGGRLVAGAVLLDDRGDMTALHSGEVVELRISRTSDVSRLVGELRQALTTDDLSAVPLNQLMRDGGVSV
jgi:hypothetical protein